MVVSLALLMISLSLVLLKFLESSSQLVNIYIELIS